MTDWNRAPKIAGDIFDQSNRHASSTDCRIAVLNDGMRNEPANRSPFTYGNCARSSSSVVVLSPTGVSRTSNNCANQGPVSAPSSPVRFSRNSRKMSRGSKTPVSSANRQNTIRTRNRSRSWPPYPTPASASCSRPTISPASMLTGSWSRKVRRWTPRMKPKASMWSGSSASANETPSPSSRSRSSNVWKSLTRM